MEFTERNQSIPPNEHSKSSVKENQEIGELGFGKRIEKVAETETKPRKSEKEVEEEYMDEKREAVYGKQRSMKTEFVGWLQFSKRPLQNYVLRPRLDQK